MDHTRRKAKPTRLSFTSSFRSVAYPSKINPFSDSDDELFFDNERSTIRAGEYSFAEEENRPTSPRSIIRDEPHDYEADSRKYEDARTFLVPKDSLEDLQGKPAENPFCDACCDSCDDFLEAEDGFVYPTPEASFERRRETARNPDSGASSDISSEDPLDGVDRNIIAMIFIGISVTFRYIPDDQVYGLMDLFLHENYPYAAGDFDEEGIEEIYGYMKIEKWAKKYCDMDEKRIDEFEKETGLSRFISRVKFAY